MGNSQIRVTIHQAGSSAEDGIDNQSMGTSHLDLLFRYLKFPIPTSSLVVYLIN